MALPPWLNINPQMVVSAAQAGGSAGLQIAAMRQRALEADAARQAQADELAARISSSRTAAAMDAQARREAQALENQYRQESTNLRSRELDIRERQGSAELALRRMAQEAQALEDATPLELRELRDETGNRVGLGYGKSVRWDAPEIPDTGTAMRDPEGNVVATRFGSRVIPARAPRALTQADVDMAILSGQSPATGIALPDIAPPAQSPDGERVMVRSPSGEFGTIPVSRLQEALRNGYQRAE